MKFKNWKAYFEGNKGHFDQVSWEDDYHLRQDEIGFIEKSLQQFQKGESSEGKYLMQFAKAEAAKNPLFEDYPETVALFIKEEQNHAAVLGRFMDRVGIKKIKSHWVDGVFRSLRRFSNLEWSVTTLTCAEIVAVPFYNALQYCTCSLVLYQLCGQILDDEDKHLQFQAHTLALLYNKKSFMGKVVARLLHKTLMLGTATVAWALYGHIFERGGYTFRTYWKVIWKEFYRFKAHLAKELFKDSPNPQVGRALVG